MPYACIACVGVVLRQKGVGSPNCTVQERNTCSVVGQLLQYIEQSPALEIILAVFAHAGMVSILGVPYSLTKLDLVGIPDFAAGKIRSILSLQRPFVLGFLLCWVKLHAHVFCLSSRVCECSEMLCSLFARIVFCGCYVFRFSSVRSCCEKERNIASELQELWRIGASSPSGRLICWPLMASPMHCTLDPTPMSPPSGSYTLFH